MDEAGLYLVNDPDYMLSVCVRLCDRGVIKYNNAVPLPTAKERRRARGGGGRGMKVSPTPM